MEGYILKPKQIILNNPMTRFLILVIIFIFIDIMHCFAQINYNSTQLLANDLETDAELNLFLAR